MPISVDQTLKKAKRHAKKGETVQAAEHYQSVLNSFPKNKRALDGLKALQQSHGKNSGPATAPSREQLDALVTLYHQGKFEQTLRLGEAMAAEFPSVAFIPNLMGAANTTLGRLEQAVNNYHSALQINPDYAEAHNNLGNAYKSLDQSEPAIASFAEALRINPDFAEAHNNLGNVHKAAGSVDAAIRCYRAALRVKPDFTEAHNNLGSALKDAGDLEGAVDSYQAALRDRTDYAEAHYNLGAALSALARFDEAVHSYRQALRIKPDYLEAHYNLGNALRSQEKYQEALQVYKVAVNLAPDFARGHNNVANTYKELGEEQLALLSYEKALQIQPDFVEAHRNVSLLKTYREGDAQFQKMLALNETALSDQDGAELHFALGKAHEDLQRYPESFQHFLQGNRLKRGTIDFQPADWRSAIDNVISTFDDQLFESIGGSGLADTRPVFVLGLPRSGKTTIERMLCNDSSVFAAGEIADLETVLANSFDKAKFPGIVRSMDAADLANLGKQYLAAIQSRAPQSLFVISTLPANFRYIGLIKLILPKAKIIHCQRDPLDHCVAIFNKYFAAGGYNWSYDLAELGEYYQGYTRLMAHWHQVLPGFVNDVQFEQTVHGDRRKLCELMERWGLDTREMWQPDYGDASHAWKHYEDQLQPLRQAL